MLNTIYLILALVSFGVTIWQAGILLGIPGAPAKPDPSITLSSLTATIIFVSLWIADGSYKEKSESKIMLD